MIELLEMSNVRGSKVIYPNKLPFSFYFSAKGNINHTIRVKPSFDPDKLKLSQTGTLKLSGDWEYTPSENDKNIESKKITQMKKFFKDNIVLFCMAWEEQMQDATVADFFEGRIDIHELVKDIDFYDLYRSQFDRMETIYELETFCREYHLVNFFGN